MKNPIIVNADDLGLSREINEGIIQGIKRGVISDTSLLIQAAYSDDALDKLKQIGLKNIGLHINLDAQMGWDKPGKELLPRNVLISKLKDKDFLGACSDQARFQIERALSLGLILTHIDCHHHVQGFFPIFELLVGLSKEYNIPAMRYSSDGYTLTTRKPIPFDAKVYRAMKTILDCSGIYSCESMVEGADKCENITGFPAELVVHPSLGLDPWRKGEMETLLSDQFHALLQKKEMYLTNYQQLVDKKLISDE